MSTSWKGPEPESAGAERLLSHDEIMGVISRNFIAVLSTVGGDQPYAIPFIYGFDGEAFFAVLSPGRKARNIESNANVCVTVVENDGSAGPWRSVVVTGKASWVEGVLKLGHALNTIRKQYPGNPVRSAPGLTSLKGYHMLRVDVEELSGVEEA